MKHIALAAFLAATHLLLSGFYGEAGAAQWPPPIYEGAVKISECKNGDCLGGGYALKQREDGLYSLSVEAVYHAVKTDDLGKITGFYKGKLRAKSAGESAAASPCLSLKAGQNSDVIFADDALAPTFNFCEREKSGEFIDYTVTVMPLVEGTLNIPKAAEGSNATILFQRERLSPEKPLAPPPSASKLPFPVYPGSTFAPEESGEAYGMATSVFYSKDSPAKIADFYLKAGAVGSTLIPDFYNFTAPGKEVDAVTIAAGSEDNKSAAKITMTKLLK